MVYDAKWRRRSGGADLPTLVAALGGNASVPAFYDVRYNVTAAAGVASQWDDARGPAGFGPSLVATGTQKPAWDANALTLTFDGVDDTMTTVASALFDISGPSSLVLVGAISDTAGVAYHAGIANAISDTRALIVRSGGGAGAPIIGTLDGAGTSASATSTAVTGTTRRVVIASKNTNGVNIDVPSKARVSATNAGGAPAAGSNTLTLGKYFLNASLPGAPVFRAALVLAREATAGDIATILAWAQANHGALAA